MFQFHIHKRQLFSVYTHTSKLVLQTHYSRHIHANGTTIKYTPSFYSYSILVTILSRKLCLTPGPGYRYSRPVGRSVLRRLLEGSPYILSQSRRSREEAHQPYFPLLDRNSSVCPRTLSSQQTPTCQMNPEKKSRKGRASYENDLAAVRLSRIMEQTNVRARSRGTS